jgi:hypothetical protein
MNMRAILIDPERRTIEEIAAELPEGEGYKEIQRLIGCRDFTSGSRPLNGSLAKGFDSLYVSDDVMEDGDDSRFWFQVDADRDPPSSYPIAGRGLVVGVDREGDSCDARITLDELRARITFTQRKFRGFEIFTGDAARARGAHIVVEAKTPIIDGTEEK